MNAKSVIYRIMKEYGLDGNTTLEDFIRTLEEHDKKHMVTGKDLSSKNEVEYNNDK